jgi:two-component system response regulator FlrC
MAQDERKGPILVVDDDLDVREAIVDTLQDEGYEVVQTPGGREALAYLRGNPPPALVFLDWNMAPMNAPQFMDEFCKEPLLCNTPVILVTADVNASQKVSTSRYAGFITKPIDLETLFSTVARFMGKK